MFKVMVAFKEVGTFEKFTDAFKTFFVGIKDLLATGTSWQILETTCFIEYESGSTKVPIDFYDARDYAYEIGLLAGEGELQEIVEPSIQEVSTAFYAIAARNLVNSSESALRFFGEAVNVLYECPVMDSARREAL